MEHTKEPWRTDADCGFPGDVMADKEIVARTTITEHSNAEANARRIVACVNACSEISTATLETVGLDVGIELVKLRQQRDELLAELVIMTDHYCSLVNSGDAGNWDCENEPVVIQSRATVAKVKK